MENKNLVAKINGYFPIAFVIALLSWTYYVHIFRLSITLVKQGSVTQGVVYIVLYHVFLLPFILSYVRVLLKEPGSPKVSPEQPNTFSGDRFEIDQNPWLSQPPFQNISEKDETQGLNDPTFLNTTETSDGAVKRQSVGDEIRRPQTLLWPPPAAPENMVLHAPPRGKFCNSCNVVKPERCHHCSACDRCILKMDHHCPWINQCVGWGNYKLFYLFILYATLFCIFTIVSVIPPLVSKVKLGGSVDIQWGLLIAVTAIFGSGLLILTGYHTRLIFKNESTIENLHSNKRNESSSNIYDLGWANNWKVVMGKEWWLWFVPTANSIGNGLRFRTSEQTSHTTTDIYQSNGLVSNTQYDMELPHIPRFNPLEPVSP
ncbi:palmitoyltransferase for Vac8p [Basidiobolus ranarum]|uniref:Palmitoyltransferase n=1 Tax=Basidiobolus ranarum TaxID=34480 RepID=A0ABR2X4Q7_9FUNG